MDLGVNSPGSWVISFWLSMKKKITLIKLKAFEETSSYMEEAQVSSFKVRRKDFD